MNMKTKKSASKRFVLTKTGKLMRRRQMGRHLRSNKSKKQVRRYNQTSELAHGFAKLIKKVISS